jgi:hypothetical protein
MKTEFLISLVLIVIHATSASAADDIRSKVGGNTATRERFRSLAIDPDASVYGVPFGVSEDEFIKTHGKPGGYVRFNDTHTALIYGRSHAIVFVNGKLMGARIANGILDWKLSNELQDWSRWDSIDWRLDGGIFVGKNLKQVRDILGDRLKVLESFRHYYTTRNARVELDFAHYSDRGPGDEAYVLHGVYVRHGELAKETTRPPGPRAGLPPLEERFGGIGATLRTEPGTGEVEIMNVTPQSPAAKAGLRKGLFIRSINGVPTDGQWLANCIEMVRGDVGTKVTLEVYSPVDNENRIVELVREEIKHNGRTWLGRETNVLVTTDQVLRLETTNGARALIQFLGFTMEGAFASGNGQDTAAYRWRFKASPSAPIMAGTNTAMDGYTSILIGANRFQRTPRNSREEAKIRAGEIAVTWSYGNTNQGYIRVDPSRLKASLHDARVFDEEL